MKVLVIIIVFFALFGPSIRENSSLGWRESHKWDEKETGFRQALIAPDRYSRSLRFNFATNKTDEVAPRIWERVDHLQGMAVPDSNIDYNSRINAAMAQIAVYKDSLELLSSDLENNNIEIGIMKGRITGLEIWLAGEKAKSAWAQSPESPAFLNETLPALPPQ